MATPSTSSTSSPTPSTSSSLSVQAVALKLPPYWPNDPLVWFAQVEAQFITRGITAEETKFAYIVSSLQPEVAQEVRDILISPPPEHPYTFLKDSLIKRTSASEQKRLKQLLTTDVIGDKKPTQVLRHMNQLLGDRPIEENLLKQLFLQRLPQNIQAILASTSDTVPLPQLAELADKIMEVAIPSVATVSSTAPSFPYSRSFFT